MTDRATGLKLPPVSRRKSVDVEAGGLGPDRRKNAPIACDDTRAAHDSVADQQRARGRARNCVHTGSVRPPRGPPAEKLSRPRAAAAAGDSFTTTSTPVRTSSPL